MAREMHAYGNEPAYNYQGIGPGIGEERFGQVERVSIDMTRYGSALENVAQTLRVHEDTETGKHFEIAVANTDGGDETVDAELSTFSSSISNNSGNAIELALHSALHPTRRRAYIASFGCGGSSYWDAKEQKYIRKTGRFVQPDGSPLPTIAALGRVLHRNDLTVSRFSTDSAGGAYTTGLMAALPEGQVTHAYLKSRPNITDHPHALAWGAYMQLGENRDKQIELEVSNDDLRVTEVMRDTARAVLQRIYGSRDGAWTMRGAVADNGVRKILTDAKALSHGGAAYGQPAAKDTLDALARQAEAKITFHFPRSDRSYGRNVEQDVRKFMAEFSEEQNTEALITLGGHLLHIAYPTMRLSFENYAFSK